MMIIFSFSQCISLKKIILYILLSKNGLDSLVKIKENNYVLEHSKDTAPLLEMLNNDFPIMSLPTGMSETETENQKKENVSQMKSILNRMGSINQQ